MFVMFQIPNDEMYWVITTIVTETNAAIRAKLMKHFIKIASKQKLLHVNYTCTMFMYNTFTCIFSRML